MWSRISPAVMVAAAAAGVPARASAAGAGAAPGSAAAPPPAGAAAQPASETIPAIITIRFIVSSVHHGIRHRPALLWERGGYTFVRRGGKAPPLPRRVFECGDRNRVALRQASL